MGINATVRRTLAGIFARDPSPAPSPQPGMRLRRDWTGSLVWFLALVVAVAGFLILAGEPVVEAFGLRDFRAEFRAPLGVTVLVGLPVVVWTMIQRVSRLEPSERTDAVLALLGIAFLGFLVAAVVERRIDYASAGLLALVGSLALLFGGRFFLAVSEGDPPRVETNWGGLGGTMGGWTVSPSMVYLLAALLFGGLATVVGVRAVVPGAQPSGASISAAGQVADIAETSILSIP